MFNQEIDKILLQVNGNRKRMIDIMFILKQLFQKLDLPHETIPISKSKKTLKYYNRWWKNINKLIEDDINKIINK